MKISQEFKSQTEVKVTRTAPAETQSFQKLVQSESLKVKQQELEELVKNIASQGEKLAHYRTLRELTKFKRLIKGFLEETVSNSYQLKQGHSIGFDGSSRKLTILKKIDEKLLELTEDVMNQEKKTVDILGHIGEIKGLLINIYT
ncbi:YaaR family protein [Oceanobacillus luteolus]|uniref:YaaR family protein n=1 Tax=Oceanobacillus luteolus TaxID=1274358 RepID=A0ABW4HNG2_9BACI|nr:YaaR family protein [Oceanobacillus luteolus]MCM3740073.1 YaaR family protein [Oceanobacillus luteolus]